MILVVIASNSFEAFLVTLWPLAVVLAWIGWRLRRTNQQPASPVSPSVEALLSPEERLKLHRVNHPRRHAEEQGSRSGADGAGRSVGSQDGNGDGDDGGGD